MSFESDLIKSMSRAIEPLYPSPYACVFPPGAARCPRVDDDAKRWCGAPLGAECGIDTPVDCAGTFTCP